MAGIKQTVAPTISPITLEEAKEHMYISITEDDALIQAMIDTSTKITENYTGLQLNDATYVQALDNWEDIITFLVNPIKSITSIEYYDTDNALQTLAITDFILDNYTIPNRLIKEENISLPDVKDRPNAILITFVAGLTTIDEPLKSYIKLEVASFYENREMFSALKQNALPNRFGIRLLDTYKVTYV